MWVVEGVKTGWALMTFALLQDRVIGTAMVRGFGSLQMATLGVAVLTRFELLGCPGPPRADPDCLITGCDVRSSV